MFFANLKETWSYHIRQKPKANYQKQISRSKELLPETTILSVTKVLLRASCILSLKYRNGFRCPGYRNRISQVWPISYLNNKPSKDSAKQSRSANFALPIQPNTITITLETLMWTLGPCLVRKSRRRRVKCIAKKTTDLILKK